MTALYLIPLPWWVRAGVRGLQVLIIRIFSGLRKLRFGAYLEFVIWDLEFVVTYAD